MRSFNLWSHSLLEATVWALNATGTDRVVGRRYAGNGAIFMLHSVVAEPGGFLDPYLQTSAAFLDRMLRFLLSRGVAIVSLDQAMARLQRRTPGPFVCFTFDDGYRDNLTVALPVFRCYDVPFTVYVTTALVERRMNFWFACLRDVVLRNDRIVFDALGLSFSTATPRDKMRAYHSIWQKVEAGVIDDLALDALFSRHHVNAESLQERDGLSRADLQTLSGDRLVEIGGHTDTHSRLATLAFDSAREDMLRNKVFLEQVCGREVHHFAYPYGDRASCGPREFAVARALGFRTATTTRFGGLFAEHLAHPTALPRLRFLGSHESRRFVEAQRNGVIAAAATRFGNPVVTD